MKQEVLHAISKRPTIRCASEADIKIQRVLDSTHHLKRRVGQLEQEFQGIEAKVDKLELELENGQKHHLIHQLSISPGNQRRLWAFVVILSIILIYSPSFVLGVETPSASPHRRSTPQRQAKLKVLSLNLKNTSSSVFMSPKSPGQEESSTVIESNRKQRLLELSLNQILTNVKKESQMLQSLFETNFGLLKFRRAENCVLNMIKIQRKLKGFEGSICQLKDRLNHLV